MDEDISGGVALIGGSFFVKEVFDLVIVLVLFPPFNDPLAELSFDI